MTKQEIQALISANLDCTHIEVEGDDGQHFDAVIVSPKFEGVSMLNQHKMIYAILGDKIKNNEVHALSLKTYSPAQWAK
ncbi:BolA family transcriptional regulator [Gammaproteobacteria bacterium]|nr:BolA family transcriptional regulator [Gammaproteobacteria bacterium]